MKQEKILKSPIASANIKQGKFPFVGLSKENLARELYRRGLIKESYQGIANMETALAGTLWDQNGTNLIIWE